MEPELWQVIGALATCSLFGLVYGFLVVRPVNEATSRITHYEVVGGVLVVLLICLGWGIIDPVTFILVIAAFAAAGFWMWLEYEDRVRKALKEKSHDPTTF